MKYWLEIIGDALLIVFGLFSVMLFWGIIYQGKVILVEPDSFIVWTELVIGFLIIVLGAYHLYHDI